MKAKTKSQLEKELVKVQKKEKQLKAAIEKAVAPQKNPCTINSFGDACKITKDNPKDKKFSTGTKDDIAYQKAKVITRALNYDPLTKKFWTQDYRNKSEKKWYIIWRFDDASGRFVFHCTDFEFDSTLTGYGVRRVFKTEAAALHYAEQFVAIENDLLM